MSLLFFLNNVSFNCQTVDTNVKKWGTTMLSTAGGVISTIGVTRVECTPGTVHQEPFSTLLIVLADILRIWHGVEKMAHWRKTALTKFPKKRKSATRRILRTLHDVLYFEIM